MSEQMLFHFVNLSGLAASNGEARRLVRAGRVLVNGQSTTDEGRIISDSDLISLSRFLPPEEGKSR